MIEEGWSSSSRRRWESTRGREGGLSESGSLSRGWRGRLPEDRRGGSYGC